ncbi:hypothetical protein ACFL3N_01375, partial [Candidatus Omnitrophota bacterium]
PASDHIFLTKSRVRQRALDPSVIKGHIKGKEKVVSLTGSVEEAIELAGKTAGSGDLILITGSLFLVGEAKAALSPDSVIS